MDSDIKQKDSKAPEERRKFPRLNINVDINYAVIPDAKQQIGASKNISAGGICILTNEELRIGNQLKLEICLPDDPPTLYPIGQVVWAKAFSFADEKVKRYDIGVEFIKISDKERERIQKYLFRIH